MNNKKRSLIAGFGAAATALALVFGGAAAAGAAPTVDFTHGNLNITKLTTPSGAPLPATGLEVAGANLPAGAAPIEDVTFSVQRVENIDLSTNAGWQLASQVTLDANGDPVLPTATPQPAMGAAAFGTTDAAGVPQVSDAAGAISGGEAFQNLPIGVYYVKETRTPAGVTPAAPFLVTIPITDPTDKDEWLSDVFVYPKNSRMDFTKTVNDAAAYVPGGSNDIVWTLNASVPRVNTSGDPSAPAWSKPTQFTITDRLDARLAAVGAADVAVKIVDGTGADLGAQPVAGTHYALGTTGNVVSVAFQGTGFDLLEAAAATPNSKVVVTITTRAAAGADIDGSIVNGGAAGGATETKLDVTVDGEATSVLAPQVESKWRNVVFTKVNRSAAPLAGAVFSLFATEANASAGTSPLATSAASTAAADNIAIDDVRVSDWQNGVAQFAGVPATGQADCAAGASANPDFRVYWLAETVAPQGYELLAEPVPVVIDANGALSKVEVDSNGRALWNSDCSAQATPLPSIENVPKNAGFVLPLTGGMGTLLLTVGGIALLVTVLLVARRRRNAEALAAE